MILKGLLQPREPVSERLYRQIVAAARQPRFYAAWGVPDTVDGRFDMIALHVFLVMDALRATAGPAQAALSQELADTFFTDMDRSLREMGVGDLSVGKKVRKMAEVFYGRVKAYDSALAEGGPALEQALARNVYAGLPATHAANLADWVLAARQAVQQQPKLAKGEVAFP